jgi:ketosteroid isomerase-like protein
VSVIEERRMVPDHVRIPLVFRDRRLKMRTLDERLTVRVPGLYRVLARRIIRWPLRSRLRRWMLKRRAVAGYHGMNRGDIEVLLAIYDPDVLVHFHTGGTMPPDLTGEYRGHTGFRDLWARWSDSWEEFRFEPTEVIDLGEVMIIVVKIRGRGRASGLETETWLHEVFTFRDGLIVSQEDFLDEDSAFEAVGLAT